MAQSLVKDDEYPMEAQRAFIEASQYHDQFLQMTRFKSVSIDVDRVKQCVQLAEGIYGQLLNQYPNWEQLLYQMATLFMQTDRNGLAQKLLEPLCARPDARIEWLNNLGAAYRNEHNNPMAREMFERALLCEESPDVLANLCALWVNEGYPERGIPYGERCLELDANHRQGIWNLGLLYLENKQYDKGFEFYGRGFEVGERHIRSYKTPEGTETPYWTGQDLVGKTIVLHGEQGIGDELLFLQFVQSFLDAHPQTRVVLDVHPRLCAAIQRSFPQVKDIFPTRKTRETPEWNQSIPVDYKDGLGSLPRWYWRDMGRSGYLKPDKPRVQKYQRILNELKKGDRKPVIGIAWTGGRKKTRNDLRSIPLDQFKGILGLDALFVSLEYWPHADQVVSKAISELGVDIHHWPDVTEGFDYDETIALVQSCDLIITVNTSIVHVCGALGKECWTLTPHGHAWRYGRKDAMNPFYKTVRQFHQEDGEGWEEQLVVVQHEAQGFIQAWKEAHGS